MSEVVERIVVLLITLLQLLEEIDKFFRKLWMSKLVKRSFVYDLVG